MIFHMKTGYFNKADLFNCNLPAYQKIVLLLLALVSFWLGSIQQLNAQAVSASWPLTANNAVSVSGDISAGNHTFSSGLTVTSYNATNGATAASFQGLVCTPNPDDYFEFQVSALCGYDLSISSVSFEYRTNSATPARCMQLKYSIDGAAETQIGSDITITNTAPAPFNSGPVNLQVPQAKTIVFRIYGATASTSRSLSCRNFLVEGTTNFVGGPLPVVSITANPSGPICAGTSVTFTASPVNGGTNPVYDWKLNGISTGITGSVYVNAGLTDGDQVSCDMTSNLLCASPATVPSNTYTTVVQSATIGAPGAINGQTMVGYHVPGLVYSIAAVPNASSYIWTVPSGWVITSGNGTTGITVTSGGVSNAGNISVVATTACATSAPSLLAIGVAAPHDNCSQCHINHTSPGMSLTSVGGNANLCMSCHNASGSAGYYPFSNAMKANPGVSGNSHAWDQPAVNPFMESVTPTSPGMAQRLPGGNIICSTCHNQHNPIANTAYLRNANPADALCKDCHNPRNVGTYASNPAANKGSHPVGVVFNAANPGMHPVPQGMFNYPDGKIECSSCHQTHYAASNDGNLLKANNDNALCTSCHVETTATRTYDHEGMGCKACHDPHNPDKTNILMVRSSIQTPNSGVQNVVFSANSSPDNYANGLGTFDGICEACHTLTDHYTNTSAGTSDSRHNPATQNCITCHPHDKGFAPFTDCLDCHRNVTDKPGVGPAGGRRQIVDNAGNGLGTGGDFKRFTHHVQGSVPTTADCIKCHYMNDHMNGVVKLMDPDLGYLNIFTYDPSNKASVEGFCVKCHDANGAAGSLTPFSDNITVPAVDETMWMNSSHKTAMSCMDCHDNGHGSNKNRMLGPYDYAGPGTGTDLTNEEEGFCLSCHGSGGTATVKVHLAFSSYTNTATDYYKHDPASTYRKHDIHENSGAAFGDANRHVECVDCHNPHAAQSGTATAPALFPTLIGVSGVDPQYSAPGAPDSYVWLANATQEYQVCFKCHSGFTSLPAYLPGGWNGSAIVADGLKKLTTGGTNGQIADSRDMAREFNPFNFSYHPVIAMGTNAGINAGTFKTGWSSTSKMHCSSCHNNPRAATAGQGRGPHGSQNLHLLDQATPGAAAVNYKTQHNTAALANSGDVCGKCHNAGSYWSGNTNSRFDEHAKHVEDEESECYLCHDSHGSEQYHLINFNRNAANGITSVTTTTQNAFAHAAGTATNACLLTCHSATHSATTRNYNPVYP